MRHVTLQNILVALFIGWLTLGGTFPNSDLGFLTRYLVSKPNIASANPGYRSKTVQFYVGSFSTNGTTSGIKNLNSTNTLPNANGDFTFKLTESGVIIKDAFIEARVIYNATATPVNVLDLFQAFDACTDPCTPNAWAASGNSSTTNTTSTWDATTGEAQTALIQIPVTSEPELATYGGGGTLLRGQYGYCLGTDASAPVTCTGAAANNAGIQYITAKLFITYLYNDTSVNLTNTVIYPLESTSSTDSGSRKATSTAGCTLGSNCPLFNYNVTLPEFTSGNQLSQWFELAGSGDSTATTDYTTLVRIGTGTSTPNMIFEQTGPGPDDFGWLFATSTVAGFSENATQTLERTGGGVNIYTLGGEVFETYTASSTAGTSTRTISLPIGEIKTGSSTASSTASMSVSFPEGVVTVRKAWSRITYTSATTTALLDVLTKVGAGATTTDSYRLGGLGTIAAQQNMIYDVIPTSTYGTIAAGTTSTPTTVVIGIRSSATSVGAVSGELMITYSFKNETGGHNVTEYTYAGQSLDTNLRSTSTMATGTTDVVIGEPQAGVTIVRAGLRAAYNTTDSDGVAPVDILFGTNMSQSTSGCTPTNNNTGKTGAESFTHFHYKDVTSIVSSTDSVLYTPCYSENIFGTDNTAGFQVAGQLITTYRSVPVANSAPTVSSVVLNAGSPITLTANATTSFNINFTVTDTNGCTDVFDSGNTTTTVFRSGVGGGCTADNKNCYTVSTVITDDCITSNSGSATATVNIYYFAQATDASSSFAADNWQAKVQAKDAGGLNSSSTSSGVELNTLLAISVSPTTTNYGSVAAGSNSGSTNQTSTISNVGNSSSTLQVSGTALTNGPNTIATSSQHYATSTFTFGGLEQILSGVAATVSGFTLIGPTTTTAVSRNTFWGVTIPGGSPTGTYSGTNTYTAVFTP